MLVNKINSVYWGSNRNDRLIYIHKDLIELYNKVKNEEKIKNIKDNDTKL